MARQCSPTDGPTLITVVLPPKGLPGGTSAARITSHPHRAMTYCTLEDLIDAYGERMLVNLTDRDELASGVIDLPTVARALSGTDALIDGYLSVRYSLPLADVPPLIRDIAQIIAIWKLHPAGVDPKIEEDYKQALRSLEGLSRGLIRLSIDGAEPQSHGGMGVRVTDRERPLTAENLRGLI